jgi:ubiquinone/menaquinone biosynthesis C-methylase UbiE
VGEGNATALPDGPFDLILCQQGLQFFPDRAAAMQEMRRTLTPGGRVALSVWQGLERHPVYSALFEAGARSLNMLVATLATPFSFGDADALQELLTAAGFQRVTVTPASLTARFRDPARFVTLTIMAAAATIPAAQQDPERRSALIESVKRELAPIVQRYRERRWLFWRDNDAIAIPMHANIAVAYA